MRRQFHAICLAFAVSGCASIESDWSSATKEDTASSYYAFIRKHPKSEHEAKARTRIELLEWEAAKKKLDDESISSFARRFPNADDKIDELRWLYAAQRNTAARYQAYLRAHPKGRFSADATKRIEEFSWESNSKSNSIDGYNAYLRLYPDGKYAPDAWQRLLGLPKPEPAGQSQSARAPATPSIVLNRPKILAADDPSSPVKAGNYSAAGAGVRQFSIRVVATDRGPMVLNLSYQFGASLEVGSVALSSGSPFGSFQRNTLTFQFPVLISLSMSNNIFSVGGSLNMAYYRAEITSSKSGDLSGKLTQVDTLDAPYNDLEYSKVNLARANDEPSMRKSYIVAFKRLVDSPRSPANEGQAAAAQPTETYAALGTDLGCKVRSENVFFQTVSGGARKVAGSLRSISCEGKDIELVSRQIVDGFVETKPYGKVGLEMPANAAGYGLSLLVTDSQRNQLLKLRSTDSAQPGRVTQ